MPSKPQVFALLGLVSCSNATPGGGGEAETNGPSTSDPSASASTRSTEEPPTSTSATTTTSTSNETTGGTTLGPGTHASQTSSASSTGAPGPFDPGPEPRQALRPIPGELTFLQLRLEGPALFLGEAGIIVGPDGTIALLDVGNSIHDDTVREAVRRLNTRDLTPARGYPRQRGPLEVDWVLLTHFHADHVGGYENLVHGSDPIQITRGVVHRGFTDLGSGITENDYEEVCESLRGPLAALDFPMCSPSAPAPCDVATASDEHRAIDCGGLFWGELDDPTDDPAGEPTTIALGDGAAIRLMGASGHVSDGTTAIEGPVFGHDDNGYENARSLSGIVEHGLFRYHFGGDLTGRGTVDDPDVESHLAAVAGSEFFGARGVDVAHVHHHARNTSSNEAFVDAVAPNDGLSRNALAGINAGHVGSPQAQTLARWLDDDRLRDGRFWITEQAAGGVGHPQLVSAQGLVIVQTVQSGRGYWAQAAGASVISRAYPSVRN